ncbi:DUF4252 domain-containing protein [Croceivirga thetidis]|uniref:DUF4252 domain-containing protein n=1 Tax=Croceivirga thetidis TaxID=2721623 RepID=A0ABX1GRQ1_9FLAO|nr:DUF4252 domain-containing protein [Croceivirga thetidis]NKI32623.1 DUF4252 domain-containing protein [Croceivirga thetidis]
MKKIVVVIAFLVMPFGLMAQSAFDKYLDSDDVGAVVINKSLLGMVANISANDKDEEAKEFIEMAENIDEIRVFITDKPSASKEMSETVKKYLRKENLELLMQVKEKDNKVDFYVKSTKNDEIVNELLMFVKGMDEDDTGFESVLVSMTGEIELAKIGTLVNKMNLPKELEKAEKGKK